MGLNEPFLKVTTDDPFIIFILRFFYWFFDKKIVKSLNTSFYVYFDLSMFSKWTRGKLSEISKISQIELSMLKHNIATSKMSKMTIFIFFRNFWTVIVFFARCSAPAAGFELRANQTERCSSRAQPSGRFYGRTRQ